MRYRELALAFMLVATTTAVAAAPHRRAVAGPATTTVTWSAEVSTSGGFSGAGQGEIRVDSTGDVAVTMPGGKTSCHYRISGDELASIERLVEQANAGYWVASYAPASNPSGCCDQFETVLRLTRNETVNGTGPAAPIEYTTQWFEFVSAIPADLIAVYRRLFAADDPTSLRSTFMPLCTNRP